MSVILEFSIDADNFELGRVLGQQTDARVELERIVPTDASVMPFFWVIGGEPSILSNAVESSDYVTNLISVDEIGEHRLYRAEWSGDSDTLAKGIAEADATVLEARADGKWTFRLRFLDHQRVGDFYNYCRAHDLSIQINRVYTLTEETLQGKDFGLTTEQREALVLALRRGYFSTPREATMEALAEELDITQQSFSDRLRRAEEKVLRSVLIE